MGINQSTESIPGQAVVHFNNDLHVPVDLFSDSPLSNDETNESSTETIKIKLQLEKTTESEPRVEFKDSPNQPPATKTESISIPYPKTCLELKRLIEEQVHIPVSLQTLYHHSQVISDTECLQCYHLRTEDIVRVKYIEHALVDEIDLILVIIRNASDFLQKNIARILEKDWSVLFTREVCSIFSEVKEVEKLVKQYFNPHTSAKTKANRVYFVNNGGIETTYLLQKHLASIPWNCMSFEMQCMERVVLSIFWNLSATLGIRCLLLDQSGLINSVCRSITRQKIVADEPITAPVKQRANVSNPFILNMTPSALLIDTMFKGMGVLTNLSEVPSCQLQIAKKERVMQQMATAMLSQSLNIFTAHIIISAFLNLSYDPKAHQYLNTPPVLQGILGSCEKHANQIYTQHDPDVVLLKYYTTLFFSLVCSTSDHFAEHESFDLYSETILSFILDFLQLYTVEEVLRIEVSAEYFWSTLKPFVNLVYFSYERKINSKLVKEKPLLHELYSYSLRATIFCLTVACTRGSDCIDVLEKEDQIDFIICLPWYVNAQFKNEAQALVDVLSSKKRLDPPKLLNIAKARLATISGFTPEEILNKTFDIHRQFYQN